MLLPATRKDSLTITCLKFQSDRKWIWTSSTRNGDPRTVWFAICVRFLHFSSKFHKVATHYENIHYVGRIKALGWLLYLHLSRMVIYDLRTSACFTKRCNRYLFSIVSFKKKAFECGSDGWAAVLGIIKMASKREGSFFPLYGPCRWTDASWGPFRIFTWSRRLSFRSWKVYGLARPTAVKRNT